MSVVAYAIRTCLGALLVDKTLAEDRVYDSAVQPIDEMMKPGAKPFIVISTDDDEQEVQGWQFSDAPHKLNVVIEVAVGGIVVVDLPPEQGGGQALQIDIPHTDEGLETSLNMIGRQIFQELQVGGEWSDLLREIAFRPTRIVTRRGANTEKGVRFAARQYVIETDAIAEPEFGVAPDFAFKRLVDMMEVDPRLAADAPLLRRMIVGQVLPDWRRAQADLGLTDRSYAALGLGPYFRTEGEPVIQRLTLEQNGRRPLVVEADPGS